MSSLQTAVFQVLEGFTLSDDVRKILEAAYYSDDTFTQGRAAGLEEERAVDCSGDPSCCPQNEGYGCNCKDVHQSIADERIIGHLLPCVPHLAQISIDGKRYCFSGVKELSAHPEMRAKAIPLYASASLSPTSSDAGKDDARDTARLDFMIDRGAFVHQTKTDAGTMAYQVMQQDEDEDYHILSGEDRFFPTYRAAIDAALSSLEVIGKGEKG